MIWISNHALTRAVERIPGVSSHDEARAVLSSAAVHCAASFGAPFVRLGTGQRIVIDNHCIVTVLPRDYAAAALVRQRVGRDQKGSAV